MPNDAPKRGLSPFSVVEGSADKEGIPVVEAIPKMLELLKVISEGGTVQNACKTARISPWKFWYHRQHNPEVAAAYEAAVSMGREAVAEECLAIARATTYETVAADRLLIDTMKWRAARVLGGVMAGSNRVNVNIDQRSIHVGEAVAQVSERRKISMKELFDAKPSESSEE